MDNVSPVAAGVQPLRKERRRFARSVRSVCRLRSGPCLLRLLRGRGGLLRGLRLRAAARAGESEEPGVVPDPGGPPFEPTPAGAIPAGSASRNGRDVVRSERLVDALDAVELHVGAGAPGGEKRRWRRKRRWRPTRQRDRCPAMRPVWACPQRTSPPEREELGTLPARPKAPPACRWKSRALRSRRS